MAQYNLLVEPKIAPGGKVLDELAPYNPNDREKARLLELKNQFTEADRVRNYPFRDFNYRPVWQYADDCQDRFINFVNDLSEGDPSQAWKANTMRPLTRNKVLEVAAWVTTRLMFPRVIAQNEDSDEDTGCATVMEDLMQWTNDQSNYDINFLYATISMLVFPVTYLYDGYVEYEREVKRIKDDGSWESKKEIDEVFSGFQTRVVPWHEVYIGNAFENDMQKQPFVVWKRIIDYSAAKVKYGNHENFKYVKPGIRFYMGSNQSIYQQEDKSVGPNGVEELVYYNRLADLELRIVNGVLMDDPDQPMKREDKRYPFAKSGYGTYGDPNFFYYKSMVDDLKPDQDQADALINLILDGTYLKMMPPSVLYGDEAIQTSVMVPGSVHPMTMGSKLEQVQLAGDVGLGVNVLANLEGNAAQSSKNDLIQDKQQTAYEIARGEEDIKTKLGLFGKMISDMVLQFGKLRINTILQHVTVPQLGEITDSFNALKYSKILIEDKTGTGTNKKIEFTSEEVPEEGMTEEDKLALSYEILDAEGGKIDNPKLTIMKVNPKMFKRLKYKVKIAPDSIFKTSQAAEREFAIQLNDRLIQDPMADQDARFKLLIDAYKPGQVEKFKAKQQPGQTGMGSLVQQQMQQAMGGSKMGQGEAQEPAEGIAAPTTPAAPQAKVTA